MPGGRHDHFDEAVVVLEEGGLKISAFNVDHVPVVPAFGYRFEYVLSEPTGYYQHWSMGQCSPDIAHGFEIGHPHLIVLFIHQVQGTRRGRVGRHVRMPESGQVFARG